MGLQQSDKGRKGFAARIPAGRAVLLLGLLAPGAAGAVAAPAKPVAPPPAPLAPITARLAAPPSATRPAAPAPAKKPVAAPAARIVVNPAYSYFTVTPCRVFDSRMPANAPALQTGVARTIQITGNCGIPTSAKVVAINATATQETAAGGVELYPGDGTALGLALVDFSANQTRAGDGLVRLAGDGSGSIKAVLSTAAGGQSTHFVLDLSGYFAVATPIAVDDSYTTTLNTPLAQSAPGVLANDTLNGAAIFSYGATTGAEQTTIGTATPTSAAGSITLNADGSFSYTPATGFKGSDTFKYVIKNSAGTSTATVTVSVGKGNQTINFTSTAPAGATVGGPTYNVTATASSGLAVAFTIDAAAASVCSISGSTVSFIGAGTCVIDANQAGDANYNPAPQVQQSFAVGKGSQTINFTSTAPAGAKVGGPTYTATATASSGLTVTLTIDASASAVCSISGSTVSFIGVGTCVIDANQAGDANYNAATQVQQSFAVGKGDQTINFTSTAPAAAKVGGPTYTVTATASSGLAVALTIDASASAVCSISGSTVSFTGAGTCVIDGNQAGNANYNAAPQAQQSFAVGKADQTINFTSTAPAAAKVGGPTYTVTATASSGLTVALTIDASASTVCSISGSTVSFIGAGSCVIDANQAGDANYNAAPQVQQTFAVAKGDQTINFTSTAPAAAKVGGPTYTVTAAASSGLTVALTIDASASAVCSISGSTVSFIGVGTCVIDGNQAGNANYNAAPQAQQSFAVAKGDQTINFTSTAPPGAKVGGPTYTVTASASSGLAVTLTIDASASAVCSISGSTVSFIGAGTCVIDGNQAGNASYNAAPQAQQSFAVAKGDQTINFTSTAPVGAKVGGPTYSVSATSSAGLTVAFTIDASASSVCSISGSTVSFIGAGTCVIDGNQAGNANYNAAPQAQQSFAVAKGDQTVSFTSTAPTGAKVGGPAYTVTATATSGLAVALTIDASATSVCSISGSTVSFIGPGMCKIDANQAGNANYNAAPQVQQAFQVNQSPQITSANSTIFHATVAGTFTVTTTATPTATSISATGTLPSGVTFVNNNNGTATLSGTPAYGTQAAAPYSLNITADNGVPPAAMQTFTLNIPNTPPQPIASPKETFDTVGNTQLEFKAAQALPVSVFVAGNLVANFTDPDGPNPLSAVAIVAGTTTNGGKVDLATNGEFTFTPKAGDAAASDSFQYQVTDGMDTVTRTVTINLKSRVWYEKNNAPGGGTGRSHQPFNTLAAAEAASSAGDYIFVYGGDLSTTGQAAGVTLQANQKLYGEAYGLTVANTINGVANPTLVAANAANRPQIDNTAATSDGVTALNIGGVEIRGLSIGATQHAVNVTTNGTNSGGATITHNVIRQPGVDGIHVAGGGTGTMTVAIQNNTVTGNVRGISVQKTAGTLYVTAFNDNVITSATPGTGFDVNGAIFDATPGGAINTVSGGATAVGASGSPVGASGMLLANVVGDLSFTSLGVYNNAGTGLLVSSTGALNAGAATGFRLAVNAGFGNLDSNGGPAVNVSGASVNLPLNFLRSTNSTTTGVSLVNAFGGAGGTTLSVSSGQIADPVGASGTAVNISGGNGNITLGVPIINNSGNSVAVASRTGDTVSFPSTITDTGSGISLTGNTGATISFTGTLSLTTGANAAFTATGGGTISSTDTSSTAATTTGTAVNVANTTIGASGLKFKSVSAGTASSGPTNGIVLNNTGSSGGLTVAGTGSAGSGGTIQKTTGDGVSLTSTAGVNFTSMNIKSSGQSGVNGSSVTGLNLSGVNITNSGTGATHEGIKLSNLLGASTWTNVTVTDSAHNNVFIDNTSGTLASLTISGGTFSDTTTPGGSAAFGFLFQARSTAVVSAVSISGATFSGNFGNGLQANTNDTATLTSFTVQSSTFTNNNAAMQFQQSQSGTMSVKVLNNTTITGHQSHAIILGSSSSTTGGTINARLTGNQIGNAGVAGSGSVTGNGIRVIVQSKTQGAVLIDGNTIRQCPNGRGIEVTGQSLNAGNGLDATVTNNNVNPQDTSGFPLAAIWLTADDLGTGGLLRADIHGNTVPAGATFDTLPTYLVLDRNVASSTCQFVGTNASGTVQLTSTNTGSASANAACTRISGPINTPP
jgi:hypothetical protein